MSSKKLHFPETLSQESIRLLERLNEGDDLTCAIVGAAFVENCMGSLLQKYFVEHKSADDALKTWTAKTRRQMCFFLGLIDKNLDAEIDTIAAIRNWFAHDFLEIGFDHLDVMALCDKLKAGGVLDHLGKQSGWTLSPKDRYTLSVSQTASRLLLEALATTHRDEKRPARLITVSSGPASE
jgi:DNA-binding MltR family transcriptional regulator